MKARFHKIDNALSVLYVFVSGLREKRGDDRDSFVDANIGSVSEAAGAVDRDLERMKYSWSDDRFMKIHNAMSVLYVFVSGLKERRGEIRGQFIDSNLDSVESAVVSMGRDVDALRYELGRIGGRK